VTRVVSVIALLALSATACAAASASLSRQRSLLRELDAHEFPQPLDEVWAEVRRLLADRGFALAGEDAAAVGQKPGALERLTSSARETGTTSDGVRALETDWNAARVRYRAEARTGTGGVRVELTRITSEAGDFGRDGSSWRDPELELQLVRRLSPEAADAIEARVRRGGPPAAGAAAPATP
jgi:hypothetical protein